MQNSGGGLKFVTAQGSWDIVTSENKYKIDAVVIRGDNISPASLEGGTWQKIAQGRVIIGASDTYPLGSTGGSPDAVVVEHNHMEELAISGGSDSYGTDRVQIQGWKSATVGWMDNRAISCKNAGESGVGKNMQPYIALNIWQKIAD